MSDWDDEEFDESFDEEFDEDDAEDYDEDEDSGDYEDEPDEEADDEETFDPDEEYGGTDEEYSDSESVLIPVFPQLITPVDNPIGNVVITQSGGAAVTVELEFTNPDGFDAIEVRYTQQ